MIVRQLWLTNRLVDQPLCSRISVSIFNGPVERRQTAAVILRAHRVLKHGAASGTPKSQDGQVEAIRLLRLAGRSAMKAHTSGQPASGDRRGSATNFASTTARSVVCEADTDRTSVSPGRLDDTAQRRTVDAEESG
jgi:hypothetical protein